MGEGATKVLGMFAILLAGNLFACGLMGWDKNLARRQQGRVPERTLFLVALLGGSLGVWAGMYLFRHKTRHLSFTYGVPAIIILQIGIISFLARLK
mgnify:CR=1 FL=1